MRMRRTVSSLALAASMVVFSGTASAQGNPAVQPAAPAAQPDTAVGLDDIVVTAQRRTERLKDVPITITAVTATSLAQAGVKSLRDIQTVVSGLTFGGTGNLSAPAIRGVSSTVTVAGAENGNALYIDGVYQSAQVLLNADLPDVDQVEVLKGPQGTLFGRNAIGGAILVHTRAPSFTPTVNVSLDAGAYTGAGSSRSAPHVAAKAYISGPLVADLVAASISGGINYTPGFLTRESTGEKVGEIKRTNVRGKLLITPATNTEITIAAHYVENNTPGEIMNSPYKGMSAAAGYAGVVVPSLPWHTDYNEDPVFNEQSVKLRNYGVSATIKVDLDIGKITSITAYANTRNAQADSIHGAKGSLSCLLAFACIDFYYQINQRDIMEDVNFASRQFGIFSGTVGLFYFDSKTHTLNYTGGALQPLQSTLPSFFPTFPLLTQDNSVQTKAFAGYGELTAKPTSRLTLIAGVRLSTEKKHDISTEPVTPFAFLDRTFNSTTPRFSIKYDVSPELSAYATYSIGYKSGLSGVTNPGNPPTIPAFQPVAPEKLKATEIGLKYATPNLTANLSAFYYDYQNKQESVNVGNAGQVIVQNTGPVRMYGLDFDFNARFTSRFSAYGGLTWIPEAKYLDFEAATATSTARKSFTAPGDCAPFDGCGTYLPKADVVATGQRLLRAPKVSANATIVYDDGTFDASATLSYSSRVRHDLLDVMPQPAYALLSAQAGYKFDQFRIGIYGRNLTNKAVILSNLTSIAGFLAAYSPPQEVGVTLNFSY